MKSFLAVITLIAALSLAPQAQEQHNHNKNTDHNHEVRLLGEVAKSSSFRAVCSKGDLNSTFASRADAVKAAQSHQKATGHQTSVTKN